PTESEPSLSTRGVYVVSGGVKYSVIGPALTKSLNCLLLSCPPASVSLPVRFASSRRGPSRYTAFMVRGLLMLSVDMSEVSSEPGREVWKTWNAKLVASPSQAKMRSSQKYCAPTLELRFSHFGCSGSAGGLTGFGPT